MQGGEATEAHHSGDATTRKRRPYRRASTIASIPPGIQEHYEEETEKLLHTVSGASKLPRYAEASKASLKKAGESLVGEASASAKRSQFQQRKSITISTDEPLLPLLDVHYASGGKKSPSRSPSSPSNILAKFKERIQQSMFINSSEWPSAAAILQERRSRANEQVKASLHEKDLDIVAITQAAQKSVKRKNALRTRSDSAAASSSVRKPPGLWGRKHSDTGPSRKYMRSDPIVYTAAGSESQQELIPEKSRPGSTAHPITKVYSDGAKDAFRRRSISEDTYDRLPPSYVKDFQTLQQTFSKRKRSADKTARDQEMELGKTDPSPQLGSSRSVSSGGIICSNDDLVAILNTYQRSRSPSRNYNLEGEELPTIKLETGPAAPTAGGVVKVIVHTVDETSHPSIGGLVEKTEAGCSEAVATAKHQDLTLDAIPPSECVYDDSGLTWDVYGAEFDPEILGEAIQRHLEKMMTRRRASEPDDPERYSSGGTEPKDTVVKTTQPKTFSSWLRFLCPLRRDTQDSETAF